MPWFKHYLKVIVLRVHCQNHRQALALALPPHPPLFLVIPLLLPNSTIPCDTSMVMRFDKNKFSFFISTSLFSPLHTLPQTTHKCMVLPTSHKDLGDDDGLGSLRCHYSYITQESLSTRSPPPSTLFSARLTSSYFSATAATESHKSHVI